MKKRRKGRLLPIFLFVGVIAASIIGLTIADGVRQNNIENPSAVSSQDDVTRLTAEEAYNAQQNDSAVIVDTRSETQFAQAHIAGAINIPLDQIETRMSELDPATWYITYCT